MTRIYVGLTLLLMSFLSALESLEAVRKLVVGVGGYAWIPELVLAAAAVGVFLKVSDLYRRLLFPRRGLRLLAAGIALYAVGSAAASGLFVAALGKVPFEKGSAWASAPDILEGVDAQPLFFAAVLLLAFGAFRALSNLVPPEEYAADY